MSWAGELAREVSGQVLTDEATRDTVATDFGRLIVRKPQAVVRPASAGDVARVVKYATNHALALSARGCGHSQTGQPLSEQLTLDLTSLNRILRVDEEGLTITCQGGIQWRTLVQELAPRGLSPPVLTNNLDVTVAGTISTAGLGVASWRH